MKKHVILALTIGWGSCFGSLANAALLNVGLFAPDSTSSILSILSGSGQFSSVTELSSDSPNLGELSTYDTILTWSNSTYPDPVGTGNALQSYIDGGGSLVVSTYATSQSWALGGGITGDGYLPLEVTLQGYTPSFPLTSPLPGDPVFAGVSIASIFGSPNSNHVDAALDAGATLLLQDNNGRNIMARNAVGNIIGLNLWPNSMDDNVDYQRLLVNSLLSVGNSDGIPVPSPVPSPATLALFGLGLAGLGWSRRKKA